MNLPKVVFISNVENPDKNSSEYYIKKELEWEVLTVHLEKRTMRVRTEWLGEKVIRNVDADPFFKTYKIVGENGAIDL